MDDKDLGEIERAVAALRERWERGGEEWIPLALDLAGNRLPDVLRELRGPLPRPDVLVDLDDLLQASAAVLDSLHEVPIPDSDKHRLNDAQTFARKIAVHLTSCRGLLRPQPHLDHASIAVLVRSALETFL